MIIAWKRDIKRKKEKKKKTPEAFVAIFLQIFADAKLQE